jgi:flagellar biosynthesis anti-sigma factor FlgM
VGQNRKSAKDDISKQIWELQPLAELARDRDEYRAQRVRQIKERIVKGEYKVDAQKVARSMIRTEVSRRREKFDR